jgi:hypothetical protein
VVLAERDDVDAGLLGEHRLVQHLPDGPGVGDGRIRVIERHVAERVEAERKISHGGLLRGRVGRLGSAASAVASLSADSHSRG